MNDFITQQDIEKARSIAETYNNINISTEAFVLGLLDRPEFVSFIQECDPSLSIVKLRNTIIDELVKNKEEGQKPQFYSYEFETVIKVATATSTLTNNRTVGFIDVVYAIGSVETDTKRYVNVIFQLLQKKLRQHIDEYMPEGQQNIFDIYDQETAPTMPQTDTKKLNAAIKEFEKYTSLVNEEVKKPSFITAIERDTEISEIERVLLRKSKNSIIITGETGVGKSHLVDSFVHKIVNEKVHESLKGISVYRLNISELMSDIKFHGILEARVNAIITVLTANPSYVLFIDEIHMLNGAGASGGNLDIMNFLKVPMTKHNIRIIGSTTNAEFRKYVEKNPAFLRRFCHVDLPETTPAATTTILNNLASSFEKHYGIKMEKGVVDLTVNLTNTYIKNRFNPDKSIDIIDSALARKKLANGKKLTQADIYAEISKECRIPTDEVSGNKSEQLKALMNGLNTRIIGQANIFDKMVDTLYVSTAGLREKEKPLGSFLFQGPTSTGKTETAKIIASNLGIPLLRYDMSAYQEKHTVATLIGSPPGYVGFSDGAAGAGKLINDIEKNPHCVLLMDEIEKAHPDVLNILLQIMDYGKLTSSAGKDVYFSKVILILTTNLGARAAEAKKAFGFTQRVEEEKEEMVNEAVTAALPPEFRARLDRVLYFNALSKQNIIDVAKLQFADFIKNIAGHKVNLSFDEKVYDLIATKAIDSGLNARYVGNYINSEMKTRIAKIILEKETNEVIDRSFTVEKGEVIMLTPIENGIVVENNFNVR